MFLAIKGFLNVKVLLGRGGGGRRISCNEIDWIFFSIDIVFIFFFIKLYKVFYYVWSGNIVYLRRIINIDNCGKECYFEFGEEGIFNNSR